MKQTFVQKGVVTNRPLTRPDIVRVLRKMADALEKHADHMQPDPGHEDDPHEVPRFEGLLTANYFDDAERIMFRIEHHF